MASQQNIIETISLDNGASWVQSRRELTPQIRTMSPVAIAALAGIPLLFFPGVGVLLYIGLIWYMAANAARTAGTRQAGVVRGRFSSVWLNIRDVQRADPTGTHLLLQWNFYTDQGVKLVSAEAYNAWLNAGRPARIVFASWQDDTAGGPLHAAEPVAPRQSKAAQKRAAKAQQAAPGDAGRLPSADMQSGGAHTNMADVLEPAEDLKDVVVCSYCGTHNKLGAHRCEGCYKMLPWDVDAAKAAAAAKETASALPVSDAAAGTTQAAPATATEPQQTS